MSQILLRVTKVKVDEIHKGWLKSFVILHLERLPLHTQLLILLKVPRVVEDGGQAQYAFKEVGLSCEVDPQRNEHCPSAAVSGQSDVVGVDLIFARVIDEPRNGTLQMEDGSGELVFGGRGESSDYDLEVGREMAEQAWQCAVILNCVVLDIGGSWNEDNGLE
jgi:hypothetical protein